MSAQPTVELLIGHERAHRLTQVAADLAPRLDYRMVADLCAGNVRQWVPPPSGFRGPKILRIIRSMVGNFRYALQMVPHLTAETIVYATGETWGMPVALTSRLLRRRFVHVVYVHRVYRPGWQWALRHMGNLLHVDGWICINQYQAQLLRDALPGTEKRVTVVSQGVDTAFFDPTKASAPQRPPYILSVGAEMRNYTLLLDAVCELDVPVILKTSSTWMHTARETLHALPPNVEIVDRRMSYAELRELYQGALLSVVPLYDTPQAAGITSILESMSLAKPVVLTRSRGLPDGLIDGRNCVVVEPDSAELASALGRLLNEPGTMANIGRCGQTFVRENYSLERHASEIARFLTCCAQSKAPQPIFRSD